MTDERWHEIEALFDLAVRVAPDERAAWLKARCQDDDELRREVESLLDFDRPEGLPVAAAVGDAAVAWAAQRDREQEPRPVPTAAIDSEPSVPPDQRSAFRGLMEGRRLGAYQIVRSIGSGGMGAVYLAERADGAIRKNVAIKFVRPGMENASLLERFRREREILASLDHPGIARLLDAGTTEEGLPYCVLEYVEGKPIDSWCSEHHLDIADRLKLFGRVCEAVQFAHQNLVVHRDLKPGNILVTASGTVKLLDFGIAKLLDPDSPPDSASTATLTRAMTLEYASPEQIRGEPLSTLTDVYSLAVVLYELLTGRRPYTANTHAPLEMARSICEQEPVPPSLAASDGKQKRQLQGDLDNILLRALRKKASERYASVEQFSEDLRRHLEGLPVRARKPTLTYRAGKLVRRHPSGVAAAVLVVMSVFAGLAATFWAARIAIEERRNVLALLEQVRRDRSPSQPLPAQMNEPFRDRAIFVPQILLTGYITVILFAVTIFLSRAPMRRVIAAAAAGFGFAATLLSRAGIGQSLLWRSDIPGVSDAFSLAPPIILLLPVFCLGGVLALVLWRAVRRFGTRGGIVLSVAVGVAGAMRDRIVLPAMSFVEVNPGMASFFTDAVTWTAALAVAAIVMRAVGGAASRDVLARC